VTRTPLSRSKGQRSRSPGRFAHCPVGVSGGCSDGRENVQAVGNCCSAAQGASVPTGEERGGGIPWRPPPTAYLNDVPDSAVIKCCLNVHILLPYLNTFQYVSVDHNRKLLDSAAVSITRSKRYIRFFCSSQPNRAAYFYWTVYKMFVDK